MDETHLLERCCHTCGNIGYEEVTSICSKCGTREHSYCMRVLAKEVPENWVCEACTLCETTVLQECTGEEHIQNSSHEGSHDKVIPRGSSQACHDSGMRNDSKKPKAVKMGKVMFLPSEEVVRLESGARRNDSPKKGNLRDRFHDSSFNSRASRPRMIVSSLAKPSGSLRMQINPLMEPQTPGTSKEQKYPFNSAKKVRFEEQKITSPSPRTAEETSDCNVNKPAKEANARNANVHAKEVKTFSANVPFKEIKTCNLSVGEATKKSSFTSPNSVHGQLVTEEKAPVAPAKDHCREEMSSLLPGKKVQIEHMNVSKVINQAPCETLPSRRAPSVPCSEKHPAIDAELKDPDVEEREPPYRPYFPSQNSTWKGGFKFFDTATPGRFYGGFQAHPPCKVRRKAYNFSMSLQTVLMVQLLPQSQVLEDLFCDRYPGSDDIALYFAPDVNIERSQENYDNLLALLEVQYSAIRSYTDGVELLVFASKLLQDGAKDPIASSSTKGFLWGVFRHTKKDKFLSRELPSLVPPLESKHQDSVSIGEAEDMEIDMIGGKDLRGDERVVPRESTRKACQPSNEERVENNLITSQDFDSSFHPAHSVSEQAQHIISLLISEVSEKINTDSSSLDLLQNSLGKLSETALVPPLESKHQDSVSIGEAEDMEIDMIGGKDLRGDERVVPRESTRKACQPSNEERVENNLITSQDFDSSFHPAHSVSEQAQHIISLLISEVSEKINTDSSSLDLLQNSLGKLSETVTEIDAPPGFEEMARLRLGRGDVDHLELTEDRHGNLQTYPIPVVADTEEFEYSQQDFSHQLNGSGETYSIIHWRPPPTGWVKLNIVSKSKRNPTIAGGSGILRDESGRWILGYTLNLGAKMGLAAELWVLFWGLLLLWERESRKVVVESECRVLVECLQRSPGMSHPHKALIDSCIGIIQREWDCRLTCIPREVNLCANCLAAGYEAQPLGRTIFDNPPPNMVQLLEYDSLSIASPHFHQSVLDIPVSFQFPCYS